MRDATNHTPQPMETSLLQPQPFAGVSPMSQDEHQPIGDVVVGEVGLALPAPAMPSRLAGDGLSGAET